MLASIEKRAGACHPFPGREGGDPGTHKLNLYGNLATPAFIGPGMNAARSSGDGWQLLQTDTGSRYIARSMTRFALQFGQTQSGLTYVERMTAYGICARGEAQIAIAQIGRGGAYEYDLPGGGIEANEDEAAALMREFLEETGLTVWPTRVIGRAGQYWVNKSEPRNSLATFYEVELSAADSAPSEPDHTLVWMSPTEALTRLRHEAHAWAVLHWTRTRRSR